MRREGYIIEEIIEYSNISDSFNQVLAGTERKRSRQGQYLLANREKTIREITELIRSGVFRVKPDDIGHMDVIEAGKLRHIQFLKSYKKSIVLNAIMSVVDKHLKKRFIRTTSASIKERGMHDLLAYIRRDIEEDPEGTRFCYSFDIKKCYESTNHQLAKDSIRYIFKDKRLIEMLDNFIDVVPNGLSIGLRPSQGILNLILSIHLDHPLKSEYGVKHYYRYCDNGKILASSKEYLWFCREIVHQCLEPLGYIVHEERIYPITDGMDGLGYIIRPGYVRLRKRIKQKFARKMHEVKSRKRRRELIASFYGMAKHADCNMLYNKLTGKQMRSFKDLNVAYKPEDGKKRFPGVVVSIRELVNLKITVKDFETGIKTEQGEDRCVVAIELNGEPKKFITNSEEMKNILAQIRELEDGFPFETTIKSESFGKGRTKYIFT